MCGLRQRLKPSLPVQSGLVPAVCRRRPRRFSGNRKHPDPLTRSPVFAHLPPEKKPGAPEIRHQPAGSELLG